MNSKLQDPSPDNQWAQFNHDTILDRYTNVHPWSNNRVRLQVPEGYNDYINASPVSLTPTGEGAGHEEKYICMQGPKQETVDHTWHMVYHSLSESSSTGVIIMLTPTYAPQPLAPFRMMEKCYPYFPNSTSSPPLTINDSSHLGEDFRATVTCLSKELIPNTAIEHRELSIALPDHPDKLPKTIHHLLYPSWPDFQALAYSDLSSLLKLMSLSRSKNTDPSNPRVIHCSAGIGRTGTYVALEYLMGELEEGKWEGWDESIIRGHDPVFEAVNRLRMQRMGMVQMVEQYVFLYEVLRRAWAVRYSGDGEGNRNGVGNGVGMGEPPAKVAKK